MNSQDSCSSDVSVNTYEEKMNADEDFYEISYMINQNLESEKNAMKLLEKEDRKCIFLKHTINNLKKKNADAEKLISDQRKSIINQQMEIEKISTDIYEKTEQLKIDAPEERISFYSNLTNVVQQYLEYLKQLRTSLETTVEESKSNSEEVQYWQEYTNKCAVNILSLKEQTATLKTELEQLNENRNDEHVSISNDVERIQNVYAECLQLREQFLLVKNKKNELEESVHKSIIEYSELKNSVSAALKTYYETNDEIQKNCNNIKQEIIASKKESSVLINEINTLINTTEKELKNLGNLINEKQARFQKVHENQLRIEKLTQEYSNMEMLLDALKQQEEYSKEMIEIFERERNFSQTTILNGENKLNKLSEIQKNLKNKIDSFNNKINLLTQEVEIVDQKIKKVESNLKDKKSENEQLEMEIIQLTEHIHNSNTSKELLKAQLDSGLAECERMAVISKNIEDKITQKNETTTNEINKKLESYMENIEELNNIVIEKQLLIDAVKSDIQRNSEEKLYFLRKLWEKEKINEDAKVKMLQLRELILKRKLELQNSIKLLEHLQKNTFPKDKIPDEWRARLNEKTLEYDKLKQERLNLERQYNQICFEKVAEKRTDTKKLTMKLSDVFKSSEEQRTQTINAYKTFAEKILKKNELQTGK